MKLPETTKEKIITSVVIAFISTVGIALSEIIREAALPFLQNIVPLLDNAKLWWACLLLLTTSIGLAVWIGILLFGDRAKKLRREYEHKDDRGYWVNRKTGVRVCGNCLIAGIESPLGCFSYRYPNGSFHRLVWECGVKNCKTEYFAQKDDVKDVPKPAA